MFTSVKEEPGLSGSLARYKLVDDGLGQKYHPVFPKLSRGGKVVLSCAVTARQLEPPLLTQLVVALGACASAARGLCCTEGEMLSLQAANRAQPTVSDTR